MIHHCAVGQENKRVGQVLELGLFRLGAVEIIKILPAEELHRHRVNLAGLAGRTDIFSQRLVTRLIKGERMAGFVRKDVDVAAGTVEIAENKRRFVCIQHRAVAAGGLPFLGEHVEQLVFEHKIDERGGFGTHLTIHPAPGGEDFLARTLGLSVAVLIKEILVIQLHIRHADLIALAFLERLDNRHNVAHDLCAERLYILLGIAIAQITVVSDLNKTLLAERLGNLGAD